MKYYAAQFQGEPSLSIVSKEVPELQPNEVLIEVSAATICGTDLHILKGEYDCNPPVVLGHEFAGIVKAAGSAVHTVRPGDLVSVEPHIYCGVCKYCRIGKEHLCLKKLAFGVHLDGGLAQYAVVPEKTVYKVPEGISANVAALTENVGCCLHGIDRANIVQGDVVVILGGGFVGIVLAELAKLRGASTVIVSEPNETRRKLLERRNVTTVNPLEQSLQDAVLSYTAGLGADIVIEAAGRADTAQSAFELVGRGGTILFFGVVPPDKTIPVSPNQIYKRELTVIGSAINPYSHHRATELLPLLNLEELVTHHYSLHQIEDAFEAARKGAGLKVAIHPQGEAHA